MGLVVDYVLARGDTQPKISATLFDALGVPVPLPPGSTVKFIMKKWGASVVEINSPATIVGGSNTTGAVEYQFVSADVDTPGIYDAQWQVTFSGGGLVQTFPVGGYHTIEIESDLAD